MITPAASLLLHALVRPYGGAELDRAGDRAATAKDAAGTFCFTGAGHEVRPQLISQ